MDLRSVRDALVTFRVALIVLVMGPLGALFAMALLPWLQGLLWIIAGGLVIGGLLGLVASYLACLPVPWSAGRGFVLLSLLLGAAWIVLTVREGPFSDLSLLLLVLSWTFFLLFLLRLSVQVGELRLARHAFLQVGLLIAVLVSPFLWPSIGPTSALLTLGMAHLIFLLKRLTDSM